MKTYKVTIEVLGEKWTKEGKTIHEALDKIDLTWEQIKGKGVIKVSNGKEKKEVLMGAMRLRRIFSNKVAKSMWAKRLLVILEG